MSLWKKLGMKMRMRGDKVYFCGKAVGQCTKVNFYFYQKYVIVQHIIKLIRLNNTVFNFKELHNKI